MHGHIYGYSDIYFISFNIELTMYTAETCLSDIKRMEPIDGLSRINKVSLVIFHIFSYSHDLHFFIYFFKLKKTTIFFCGD